MVFSQLIFSLFCVLDTLIPALATYCICACSEHAHQWLWRGPPGNHSHHSLGTAFSSNRKSTQRQEPPLICRQIGGALQAPGAPAVNCVGSTVIAVPSSDKGQPRASVPVLFAIFTNSRLSFSSFLLSILKQNNSRPFCVYNGTQSPRN